jgi:hypothetical protein
MSAFPKSCRYALLLAGKAQEAATGPDKLS